MKKLMDNLNQFLKIKLPSPCLRSVQMDTKEKETCQSFHPYQRETQIWHLKPSLIQVKPYCIDWQETRTLSTSILILPQSKNFQNQSSMVILSIY